MKTLIAVASLFTSLAFANSGASGNDPYVYLQDKYPAGKGNGRVLRREAVAALNKKQSRFSKLRASKTPSLSALNRVPDNCTYPIEVVIVQDVTDSFSRDMTVMAESELPTMFHTLSDTHPGSTFGIVSFGDKPIKPFGSDGSGDTVPDYCYHMDAPLGQSLDDLTAVYKSYEVGGGGDAPENQYGAIFDAIQDSKIGWGSNPEAIRLLVVSTNSPPHYDDDRGNVDRHGLAKFSGVFEEDNADGQCKTQFYPSWQQTIGQINKPSDDSLPLYVAFLVYDNDPDMKTLGNWEWVASQIHENSSFVRPRAENSSNFWEELSQIIGIVDEVECQAQSTTMAPTTTSTAATSTTRTTRTTTPRTSTTKGSTPSTTPGSATAPTTPTTTSTAFTTKSCPACPCPGPHPCHGHDKCGNEAYIRYPKDVKVIDVHIVA